MIIVNVTLSITDSQKEYARDLAKELGVNPNAFMSACLVHATQGIDKSSFHTISNLMDYIAKGRRDESSSLFFADNDKQPNDKATSKVAPPKK